MVKIIWLVVGLLVVGFGAYWVLGTSSVDLATSPTATTTAQTNTSAPNTPEPISSNNKFMQATLHTTKGDIVIELFEADAPNTVANFVKLAQAGFYDGTKFHRVIKDFMIQGGDPLSRDDSQAARWGTGGPGYNFADEIRANNHNNIGTISMANAGPNTNGSQFFINVASNNFLDTKHTTFGKVIKGLEVVEAIENTPTGANDRPVEAMVINSITFK
ncbi:MAG: Peptidylprolyl isomerase [Parcubacteria group bacterium Gr01-1014_56]|nr:MAG: Peptidylprolyl isomerase [Parcubacteria group bacterium Gr01-1014_56]